MVLKESKKENHPKWDTPMVFGRISCTSYSHLPKADLLTFWFSNFGPSKGPKRLTFYFLVFWASEYFLGENQKETLDGLLS